MSSFFDDASLVMIPSGYKDGTVYSVKPIDGDGDLTFTRSNDTATRVGPDGLIEKVRVNEYYKSTEFTTSSLYVTYGASPVSTGTYPVDSSSLAYSFAITGPNQGMRISLPNSSSPRCFSIYLKDFGDVSLFSTGTATVLGTIADAGTINGYVRYVVTIGAGDRVFSIRPNNNSGTATTVFATAPQVELGDIPTAYIVNDTTSSVVSVGPIADLPRLDYSGGATCPKLLLEPQRINLAFYSEQLDNAYWTKSNTTITANTSATLDPTGANGADKIVETATTAFHAIERAFGTLSGSHSLSVFAKAAERNYVYLEFFTGATSFTSFFDLSNGTIGTSAAGNNAKIENYGNGWYRLSISRAAGSGTSFFVAGLASADNTPSYTGNGTSGAFLYGCQLEQGSYATSYIPTIAAAVTRGVDDAYKTGIGSLFGTNAGTIYFETIYNPATNLGGGERWVYAQGNTSSNYVRLWQDVTGGAKKIRALVNSGGVLIVNLTANATSVGLSDTESSTIKFAFAYEDNRFQMYVNGINAGVDTSGTAPTLTEITFNSVVQTIFPLAQCLVFPTALTNAQMAELTSL